MKVSKAYELRNILDENIVVPKGSEMSGFSGTIVLSDTAAFVWERLSEDVTKEELVAAVVAEFEVDEEVAKKDLEKLLEKLRGFGVLEE